jgi:hypothetical protein
VSAKLPPESLGVRIVESPFIPKGTTYIIGCDPASPGGAVILKNISDEIPPPSRWQRFARWAWWRWMGAR